MSDDTPGTILAEIASERRRQVEVEGWPSTHDDRHVDGQLAAAAGCYAITAAERLRHGITMLDDVPPREWPWAPQWWKPKDQRRDLIRAAALIVAEIERLDRASTRTGGER